MRMRPSTSLLMLLLLVALFTRAHDHHDHDDHHGHSHDHHGHSHGGGDGHETKPAAAAAAAVNQPNHPEIPEDVLQRLDFLETFQDGPKALEKGRWVASKNERYSGHEWSIDAVFSAKADKSDEHKPGFKDEKSLAVHVKHKHYGLTHVLEQPFDNTGKTLVYQYEVRFHDGIGCSGAYAKLLLKQDNFDPLKLEEATPYVVMFGPDRCGGTNKVHFIVRQKLANNKWEEKHMTKIVAAKTSDSLSHLYTLVIRPDNTFKVLVDMNEEASGSLLSTSDFTPPFGAPKEIDDPEDKKPKEWVDQKEMPDPSASKPVDWDEDAPANLPDPDAKKPADWNDEEDGDWMPPSIPNPEFKGKWKAPIIPNPDYKGEWKPRRIPNPDHFEDLNPSNLAPIGAISFEILANDRGIAFDNILLTHDEDAAKEVAFLTYVPKVALEKSLVESMRKLKAKEERLRALNEDGTSGMVQYYWGEVREFVSDNIWAVVGTSFAVVVAIIAWFTFAPAKPAPKQAKNAAATGSKNKTDVEPEPDEKLSDRDDREFSPPNSDDEEEEEEQEETKKSAS